ncbi:MAG: glycoside hydrolase family 43 protein [Bacteroidales bacterium]|nr:glycoside hydrolase family 43 protein [Bacteroidales bacterium]
MKTKNLLIAGAFAAFSAIALNSCSGSSSEVGQSQRTPIAPVEQAPPADPGQNNFGGSANVGDTTGMAARMKAMREAANKIRTVHFNDLSMSDPFIYAEPETKTYYLTSSGGRMYKSTDLVMWEGPYTIADLSGTWCEKAGFAAAVEIHKIGKYYYYAGTYSDHSEIIQAIPKRYNVPHNQTYLLRSENVEGPYVPFSIKPGYDYQPYEWDCIDGTLYEEDGHIYMVFVHEWTQLIDGTMDYIELSEDLTYTKSEWPVTMFRASEAPFCREMNSIGEATFGLKMPGWVTDGPQMFRTQTGKLGMLWSTWGEGRYLQGVCYSESGTIAGPWIQEKEAFLGNNSGHGMLFRTFEGRLVFLVHHSEGNGPRKPQYWSVDDSGDKLVLGHQLSVTEKGLSN